jgi:hypothetical protein
MTEELTGEERFADPQAVIQAALNDPDWPEDDIERFEMTFLPTGKATWRVWARWAEEPVGGVYRNS